MALTERGEKIATGLGGTVGAILVFLVESAAVMASAYMLATYTSLGVPPLGYGESLVVAASLYVVAMILRPLQVDTR